MSAYRVRVRSRQIDNVSKFNCKAVAFYISSNENERRINCGRSKISDQWGLIRKNVIARAGIEGRLK